MANFYGAELLFDSKSSMDYNLRISNFESGGTSDGDGGSEPTLYQKYLIKRSSPYYFGRSLHTPLSFNITLSNFDNSVSAIDRNEILGWLSGRSDYKKLSIVQDDMEGILFNAIINKSTIKYVGNVARGVTIEVKCKEPWGFESAKTITKTSDFSFYNSSAHDDYLYPQLIIKTTSGGDLIIRNITDNNRSMVFTGIQTGAILTIDCDRQIISNNMGTLLNSNFNKIFFRLVPGMNSIQLIGSFQYFMMTYQFARKIGG